MATTFCCLSHILSLAVAMPQERAATIRWQFFLLRGLTFLFRVVIRMNPIPQTSICLVNRGGRKIESFPPQAKYCSSIRGCCRFCWFKSSAFWYFFHSRMHFFLSFSGLNSERKGKTNIDRTSDKQAIGQTRTHVNEIEKGHHLPIFPTDLEDVHQINHHLLLWSFKRMKAKKVITGNTLHRLSC